MAILAIIANIFYFYILSINEIFIIVLTEHCGKMLLYCDSVFWSDRLADD